jgi:predicted nucleic acid-binding protein
VSVVVDSSIWIEFFRGKDLPALESALAEGRVLVPPIVVSELVSGAVSRGDARRVRDVVLELDVIDTPRDHWIRVGELRRELRARGLAVSTPDAHVAQCALDVGGILLSSDAVFRRIARLTRLELG